MVFNRTAPTGGVPLQLSSGKPAQAGPAIIVVISVFNGAHDIGPCIDALLALAPNPPTSPLTHAA